MQNRASKLRVNVPKIPLTRKTFLGHVEKDPEEGAVSFRNTQVISSFSPKTASPSSAFSGKIGNRFKDVHSHYKKPSGSVERTGRGHKTWKPKGNAVSLGKNPSPRFSTGGIYKKANTDDIGMAHKDRRKVKGSHNFSLSPARNMEWLNNKGNRAGEGEESFRSGPLPSTFSGRKTQAPGGMGGKMGSRFTDHNSHLNKAKNVDHREQMSHKEWKSCKTGGPLSSRSSRFVQGGIYKKSETDGIGPAHNLHTKTKGAGFSKDDRKLNWMQAGGLAGDDGSETWLTNPVKSSFAKAAKPGSAATSSFGGKIGARFNDHQSHLKKATHVDERAQQGHTPWKPSKNNVKMDANLRERFESPGSIYKK